MTITYTALHRADAARCAELEAQLFEGDDPWPASAFYRELEAKHNHYVWPPAPRTSSSAMEVSPGSA